MDVKKGGFGAEVTSTQATPAVAEAIHVTVVEGVVTVVKVVVTVLAALAGVKGVAAIVSVAVVAVTVQEAVVTGIETLACVAVASPEPVVHEHSVR